MAADRPEPLLHAELARLGQRVLEADEQLRRARALGDQGQIEEAETERREAAGAYHGVAVELADVLLLLLRQAREHRPLELREHLRDLVREAIADELNEITEALARLEAR